MGWLGSFLIIFGAWQIGHKRRWGFLVTFLGGMCWVMVGFQIGRMDVVFIDSVMGFVSLRNFWKWGRSRHGN